jgi:hypothetical protein
MVHSGSPSLHTDIEESTNEGNATSGKGEQQIPRSPRVQCGDPDCPHHHHTTAGEHSSTPNHPDDHGVDRHTTTRYKGSPRAVGGLSGGVANVGLRLVY